MSKANPRGARGRRDGKASGAARIPPAAASAACFLLSLLALQPLLAPGYQWGHDTGAHLFRSAEVARALREGVLYPRFLPDAYGGLGGPILDFNPTLPYYFPALLILLGLGPIAALKVAAGAAMIAGGIAAAVFARPHAGRIGAALTGLAYVYLPYHIADIYVRMAYSELVAMIFFPLALATARRAVLRPSPRRIAIAAVTLALIPATHFPSTVIGLPAIFLYAAFTARRGARLRGIVAFAAVAALALALSAFSWLPALADQGGTHYADSTTGYDNYRNHFLELPQLFSTSWGFGQSLPGSADQMSFQIGWAHLIALGVAVAAAARHRSLRKVLAFTVVLVAGGSLLMLSAARPLWDFLPILQAIQFPWRLLMVTGLGTSLAAGIVAALPARSATKRVPEIAILGVLAATLVAACLPYLKVRSGEGKDADFTPEAIRRQYFGELKFQPKEVETMRFRPSGPRTTLLDGAGAPASGGTASIVEERTHRTSVEIDAPAPATLRVHLFDTPGWRARIDGVDAAVHAEPRTALVLVEVPAGRHRVELRFGDTPIRRAGWGLALAGIAVILATNLWTRRR